MDVCQEENLIYKKQNGWLKIKRNGWKQLDLTFMKIKRYGWI